MVKLYSEDFVDSALLEELLNWNLETEERIDGEPLSLRNDSALLKELLNWDLEEEEEKIDEEPLRKKPRLSETSKIYLAIILIIIQS